MPRVVNIYRNLLSNVNPEDYLIELVGYSDSEITVSVYSDTNSYAFKIEDTIPTHKKADSGSENIKVYDLDSKEEFSITEKDLYEKFPVFK